MFADNRIVAVGGMGAKENALDSIEQLSEDGKRRCYQNWFFKTVFSNENHHF